MIGLQESVNEDVSAKIDGLLVNGLKITNITPKRVIRLKSRNEKPGVIKVEFDNKDQKIAVLSVKNKLKGHRAYTRVYIASCKTHTERLLELNMKTLLSELPNGNDFTFSGNGRLFKKDPSKAKATADRTNAPKRTRPSSSSTDNSVQSPAMQRPRLDNSINEAADSDSEDNSGNPGINAQSADENN